MPTLLVSFDIERQDIDAHDQIHDAFLRSVRRGRTPQQIWTENASFCVISTPEPLRAFAARVVQEGGLRRTRDRVMVLDAADTSGIVWGAVTDTDLFALLPNVHRV
jgi:hypothetical protein